MSQWYKRIEILDNSSSPFFFEEIPSSFFGNKPKKSLIHSSFSSIHSFAGEEELGFALDLLNLKPVHDLHLPLSQQPCFFPSVPPSTFDFFETITDLIQVQKTPFSSSFSRIQERTGPLRSSIQKTEFEKTPPFSSSFNSIQERTGPSYLSNRKTEFEKKVFLESLSDRVSALELGFEQIFKPSKNSCFSKNGNRESEGGIDRKYIWTAQIKGGKGNGSPIEHKYTFKAKTMPVEKKKAKAKNNARVVEINGPEDQNAIAAFKQKALARKRAEAAKVNRGKQKELSPVEAALIIQIRFRAYLVRRSQTLRGLRDLAVAKAKLKELKDYFTNFSYRRRIAADAEERQRFSEKIIVLLLTVDAIEGTDHMVREARRGMVEELEAMLEVVDPQPPGKLGSMKRRKFDLPENGPFAKEMAVGVAGVVEMLNQEESSGGSAGPFL